MQNHYHTLGLSQNASQQEIKGAFKRLAVKYHPDKHMGDTQMEEKFKAVNQAYQVLSDPYKKAQFDLQLQYEQFTSSQRTSQGPARPHPYQYQSPKKRYGGRPHYRAQPINRKENNKATMYAFAITFGIALMVMVIKSAYDMYLQRKYEKFLAERREAYDEALSLYNEDEIQESLLMLSELAPFHPEESDMKAFRVKSMEDITFKGEESYLQKDYVNAIRYYELVDQFSAYRPMAMRARLAQSYRYVDQPELSIRKLKELIEENYQVVATLVQIAEVYEDELNDLTLAEDYLELARDVAVREYRQKYGKAYMLVVNQELLPYDHYFLFQNLAKLYNTVGQPEESLGATNWMKRIWPDSIPTYTLAAQSYELQGNQFRACQEYRLAKSLGYSEALPLFCQ